MTFSLSPTQAISSLWRNRHLLMQLTRREVIGRYRGSVIGIVWSFLYPLLMLAVYTFVFSVVFNSRWGESGNSNRAEFAVIVFVGMIVHGFFAECLNRAPGLVLNNANYVKRVVFPLEILVWVNVGAALFHAMVSTAVLLIFVAVITGSLHSTILLFPLLMLPLVLMTAGFCWLLASLGVYLRDVAQVIGVVTNVLLFMSPVFFPISALPPAYQKILHANPLTFVIEQARDLLIFGRNPDWSGIALYTLSSLAVAWLGFAWFQRTRNGFADVL